MTLLDSFQSIDEERKKKLQTPSQKAGEEIKQEPTSLLEAFKSIKEPTSTPTPTPTPTPQLSFWEKAKQTVGNVVSGITGAINKAIPGGIAGGIERVKQTPISEYFMPTSKQFEAGRQYVADTLKLAVGTAEGVAKLTPAYNLYRAVLNDPVKPKEYATQLLTTGLDSLGLAWRVQPEAPIAGYGLNTWVGVRRYIQGKIDSKELVSYLDPQGINQTPSVGALVTDNIKWAEAIDIVFMATMIAKPFAKKGIGSLVKNAQELNATLEPLGLKPNATSKDVSEAIRQKMRSYPDMNMLNPSPEGRLARRQIADVINVLKKAGVLDKKFAEAFNFIQEKLNVKFEPFKTESVPKELTAPATATERAAPTAVTSEVKPTGVKKIAIEKTGLPNQFKVTSEGKVVAEANLLNNGKTIQLNSLASYEKGAGTKTIESLFQENPTVEKIVGKYTKDSKGFYEKLGATFSGRDDFSIKREVEKPPEVVPAVTTPPTTAEEVKVVPKTVSVPREQLPVGQGKEKASKLEARMKGVIGNATPEQIEKLGLSTYKTMNQKEQIAKAAEYVTNNQDEALEVIRGNIAPPKGLIPESIYIALTKVEGDPTLITKLASFQATALGQRIGILSNIDKDNPVRLLNEVYNVKVKAIEKRYGKPIKEVVKKEIKNIKKEITLENFDVNAFIDSIETCK
jgi:hypothetical protein